MSDTNPMPTPRYRIEFKAYGQTWAELEDRIRQMQQDVALRREPGPVHIASGGWHVIVTEHDPTQTPERWAEELEAWAQRNREERRAARDETGAPKAEMCGNCGIEMVEGMCADPRPPKAPVCGGCDGKKVVHRPGLVEPNTLQRQTCPRCRGTGSLKAPSGAEIAPGGDS